jgi:hypothetical protein
VDREHDCATIRLGLCAARGRDRVEAGKVLLRFASIPVALALSAVVGAQQPAAPRTPPPQPSVPPPITFPFAPLMQPPAGGLTSPVPFTPTDLTRPARDLYRLPSGEPFRSRPRVPVGSSGGAYFGPIYTTPEAATTPGRVAPVQASGLLRFDVTPESAQVFVDSFYAGRIADIDDQRVLTLAAGPHRIELRAQDYAPVTFDIRINPNETITYRASLEPARPAAQTPVSPRPAGPTRIYVIPGCYAGNLAPRADRLPAGCNIKLVRVLEPPR